MPVFPFVTVISGNTPNAAARSLFFFFLIAKIKEAAGEKSVAVGTQLSPPAQCRSLLPSSVSPR